MPAIRRSTDLSIDSTAASQRVILPLMLAVMVLLGAGYSWKFTRGNLDRRDWGILDQYREQGRKTPVRDDIVILGIDDVSRTLDNLWPEDLEASPALREMKRAYPFPRRVWAMLADRLFDAGAKMVFLDLTFFNPDRNPEDDRLLKEALERHAGKLVIGGKFEKQQAGQMDNISLSLPNESVIGPGGMDHVLFGLLNFYPDPDGVIRMLPLQVTPVQAEILNGARLVVASPDEKPLPHVVKVMAEAFQPSVLNGVPDFVNFRFCLPDAYPWISLHEVFVQPLWESNLGAGAKFKDKIVMVGAVATDLQDFQRTPFGEPPGVVLHAHALTALLAGEFITDSPQWWMWAGLAMGFLLAWTLMTFVRQPLFGLAGLGLLTVGAYYGGLWAFDHLNRELSPLPFSLALNLCGIAGLGGNYFLKLRETRKLQRFLARYTSPELVREMMRDRAGLYTTLKGEKKVVTILFSDVRGFTSMSENMEPTAIVMQLNEYLSRMVEAVVQHRGLVDKFIGDAVMALWGSIRSTQGEEGDRQDALNAVRAALTMRAALEDLNQFWATRGLDGFKIGMGIHQGEVVAGNIGSDEKMDLTVIGDNVNLASRLEGTTKKYGVDLVVSGAVQTWLGDDFLLRPVDLVRVVGKVKPVEMFAVLGMKETTPPSGLADFAEGVRTYRAGRFTEALGHFNNAADAGLADTLTREYQERCEDLIQNPPEKWDGVYTLTKK